jgi:hypothetical protein
VGGGRPSPRILRPAAGGDEGEEEKNKEMGNYKKTRGYGVSKLFSSSRRKKTFLAEDNIPDGRRHF